MATYAGNNSGLAGNLGSRKACMNSMVMIVATRYWALWRECVRSWEAAADGHLNFFFIGGKDVVPAYQEGYRGTTEAILGHVHDDLVIYESGWDTRILKEFEDATVGMVGFTGALGHGTPNLYTNGYYLPNLARQNFMSNLRDAEKHGQRLSGERFMDLSRKYGVGSSTVFRILRSFGIPSRRGSDDDKKDVRRSLTTKAESKIITLYKNGTVASLLAFKFNVSPRTIYETLARNGCERRPRGSGAQTPEKRK